MYYNYEHLHLVNSDFVSTGHIHGSTVLGGKIGINLKDNHYVFEVDSNGKMTATEGDFGLEIVASNINSSSIDNTDFKVGTDGKITINNANLSNWNVNSNSIYAGNLKLNSSGSITYEGKWKISNTGVADFSSCKLRINSSKTTLLDSENNKTSLNDYVDNILDANTVIVTTLTTAEAQTIKLRATLVKCKNVISKFISAKAFKAENYYTDAMIAEKIKAKKISAKRITTNKLSADRINTDYLVSTITRYLSDDATITRTTNGGIPVYPEYIYYNNLELTTVYFGGVPVLGVSGEKDTDWTFIAATPKGSPNPTYLHTVKSSDEVTQDGAYKAVIKWIDDSDDYELDSNPIEEHSSDLTTYIWVKKAVKEKYYWKIGESGTLHGPFNSADECEEDFDKAGYIRVLYYPYSTSNNPSYNSSTKRHTYIVCSITTPWTYWYRVGSSGSLRGPYVSEAKCQDAFTALKYVQKSGTHLEVVDVVNKKRAYTVERK